MGGKVKDRGRAALSQLTKDFRMIMEPHTASRLRERQKNKLRDYVAMAGPLGVSHLLLFSRPDPTSLPNLRFVRCPRGPTLHFRISKYSLCKDVRSSQRAPRATPADFLAPPLLVMNNFSARSTSHDALITSMFQHLFPPISASKTSLSSIRRVLLLHKDPNDPGFGIELRHYSITTKSVGVSRQIRKLEKAAKSSHNDLPNLGSLSDISQYLLEDAGGYTSGSEVEEDSKVEIQRPKDMAPTEQKAVKLVELGPRLHLDLVKIEEGVCQGKILHHAYVHKTKAEETALEKRHQAKKAEKERRRKEQAENVERKNQEKRGRQAPVPAAADGDDDVDVEEMVDDEDSDEMEDVVDPLDEAEMESDEEANEDWESDASDNE